MTVRRALSFYGWLFAVSGLAFLAAPGILLEAMRWSLTPLPGARLVPGAEPSLWLGLTGALMVLISRAAFNLSRDPLDDSQWTPLMLSKAVSSGLFALFAASERNPAFLAGSAVDGAILLHLAWLRGRAFADGADPLGPRSAGKPAPFYEAWFAKLNDPATKSALWVRYTLARGAEERTASVWYVLFDAPRRRILRGRWDRPLEDMLTGGRVFFRLGGSSLERGRIRGEGPDAGWDLSWEAGPAPPFDFAPPALSAAGLLGSGYVSAPPLARFTGSAWAQDVRLELRGAAGSLGHLWGPRMARGWRWAHAVFEGAGEPAVFEILTARLGRGSLRLPELTTAHLWFGGRHRRSTGLLRALSNSSARDGERWSFQADFGDVVVSGECSPDDGFDVTLPYRSPEGRDLDCRNSKTGSMRLAIRTTAGEPVAELALAGGAAVEYAGEP